ncbi:MAG: NUDIX domain-containing protein [Stappiaceae bacterium]
MKAPTNFRVHGAQFNPDQHPHAPTIDKSYIYMTCDSELLVFLEPENPDIGLQLPGGTLDPEEGFEAAARREFFEETGHPLLGPLTQFAEQTFPYVSSEGPVLHNRRMFHAPVAVKPDEAWDHYEMDPSDGGDPILFRFFWVPLLQPGQAFHVDFEHPLPALYTHLSGKSV